MELSSINYIQSKVIEFDLGYNAITNLSFLAVQIDSNLI